MAATGEHHTRHDALGHQLIVVQAEATAVAMIAIIESDTEDPGEEVKCTLKRKNAIRRRADSVMKLADLDCSGLYRSNVQRRVKTDGCAVTEARQPEASPSVLKRAMSSLSWTNPKCEKKLFSKIMEAPRRSRFIEHLSPVDVVSTPSRFVQDGQSNSFSKVEGRLKNVFRHRPSYSGVQVYEGC